MPLLTLGKLQLTTSRQTNLAYMEQSKNFIMISERLYKHGKDQILRLCIEKKDTHSYLYKAHVAIGYTHFAPEQTVKRIERMGVY